MGFDYLIGQFSFQKFGMLILIYIFYKFFEIQLQIHATAVSALLYIIMKYVVMIVELNEHLSIFTVWFAEVLLWPASVYLS